MINRRVGLNALAMITILAIFGLSSVLFTMILPGTIAGLEWSEPLRLSILGWEGVLGFFVLILYIIIGYYHSYRPIYKRPFVISYWIFLAVLSFFFINIAILPSASEFTSFQTYYINYFGWYQGHFVRLNIDVIYGFKHLGVIQVFALINLVLSLSIGRIRI